MKGETLGLKAVNNYNGNTKAALATLVRFNVLTNTDDGYGLPGWP